VTTNSPSSRIRCRRRTWLLALIGILVAGGVAAYALTRAPKPRITWLSPVSAKELSSPEPGPMVRLKSEYLNLIGPMWRRPAKPAPVPQLLERGMILSEELARRSVSDWAATTNEFRQKAWILSPNGLREFQLCLEGDPGARILREPGYPAPLRADFKEEIESGAVYMRERPPGRPTRNFAVKKLLHAYQIHINEIWVRRIDPQPQPNQIALSAVIPKGSSILVDSAIAGPGKAERYWFIFTPVGP
jgi:hypothetical protein